MLELQTERLRILALERDHLALLLHHPDQFDKDMTLNSPAPGTQNPLAVSHEEMGRRVDEDPERYYPDFRIPPTHSIKDRHISKTHI